MRINESELIVEVDVDETLINVPTPQQPASSFDYYGTMVHRRKNFDHIDLIRSYKQRGYYIIVHSANGWRWAKEVVNELSLNEFVDEIRTKPIKYVDDKPADQWMQRVFIGENK